MRPERERRRRRNSCALRMAWFVLCLTRSMTPLKRHQVGGPEIVQFAGLLILIALIYKHFGPVVRTPVTLSALVIFAVGLFLLIWPMSLKARQ
jgi:hypothetical protein